MISIEFGRLRKQKTEIHPGADEKIIMDDSNYSIYSDYPEYPPPIRICSGHVGAYLNRNRLVWFSNVYCIPFIAICGIFCNLLNIVVLWCPKARRLPSCTYLMALALCDSLFLIFGTLEVTPIHIDSLSENPTFNKFYIYSVVYIRVVASTCYKASVILVISFNIERYICVCHPLRARDLCNKRTSRWVVIGSLLGAALLSVQWPISYRKDSCYNILTNDTYYLLKMSSSKTVQKFYKIMDYTNMVLFNLVPVFILLVLNSALIQTLRRVITRDFTYSASLSTADAPCRGGGKRRRVSAANTAAVRASWGANAILFAVVLMFIICLGPQIPARILFEIYGADNDLVLSYMAVSQQLIFLNASLNFCLFCLVSRRYRNLMRRTLKRMCGISVQLEHFRRVCFRVKKLRRKSTQRTILDGPVIVVAVNSFSQEEEGTKKKVGGIVHNYRSDFHEEEEEDQFLVPTRV